MPGEGGRRLRVALIVPPYFDVPPAGYGGIEAVVAELANALVARGHSVVLFGAGKPGTAAAFVPLWERTIPERLGKVYPELAHAAVARRAVEWLASAGGLDVVHDHSMAGPLYAPAYAALGLPTVVTVHGPVNEDQYRLYRALGTDVHLVAISDRQRALAPDLSWLGTVHNGLRVEDWPFRARKRDYVLFLGRFTPDKGTHLALEAAHKAGLPLILAGKCAEPAEREYFEQEVRPRLSPGDRFVGVADAAVKRKLLAGARCLLFPVCWEEPFGMVMIEAMACGTPVVALRAGAVPEVVADRVTGLICESPEDLAEALEEVRGIDPAACRAHVAEHFSSAGLGCGYESMYMKALARVRSRATAGAGGVLEALRRCLVPGDGRDGRDHALAWRSAARAARAAWARTARAASALPFRVPVAGAAPDSILALPGAGPAAAPHAWPPRNLRNLGDLCVPRRPQAGRQPPGAR
jgi:glycosyltransferase involved in cell wall biosynthesis